MMQPAWMKFFTPFLLLIVITSGLRASERNWPLLITPSWLTEHQKDPNVVILNVTQNLRDYRRGHISGARFLWPTWVAANNPELSFELLPVDRLDTLMEGLGITNDSRIVLCGVNGNVSPTARVYATLEYLGMGDRTSILDGGFEAWKKEGFPVSTETPVVARTLFTPHLRSTAFVDAEYVSSNKDRSGFRLVDARAPQYYNGDGGGFPRPGRIPGAVNLFFATLFDTANRYLPMDSLQAKFEAAGIKPADEVIVYCHVGQTASSDYLAAKLLGHKVHLYDGSFEDWSGRLDLPVFVEPKKDSTKK